MSHTVQTVPNIHDECKDKLDFAEELVYWLTHICQDADTLDHIPLYTMDSFMNQTQRQSFIDDL